MIPAAMGEALQTASPPTSTPPAARPRTPRGLVPLALLAVAWCLYTVPIRWEFDTQQLQLGLAELIAWARHGFVGRPQAGPFPPFQYLIGLPVALMNRDGVPINVFWVWASASLLSLGGIGWVLWRVGRRHASAAVGWLLVVVLLSGPLITYAPSTFNELPAALVTVLFTAAVVGRGGAAVSAVLFVAAALTKEIAPPLLALIWITGMVLRRAELGRAGIARHGVAMTLALAIAVAAHFGFNWIRYGSVWNLHYLAPEHLTRAWPRRAQNAVALWLAPNGGVLPFWPTLLVPVAIGAAVALSRRTCGKLIDLFPAAAVAAMLAALTLGLSGFYQPFGWWCWGPRLMLPWLPAALLVLVRAYPRAADRVARMLLARRAVFALTAALACVAALPHLGMLANPRAMTEFFMPDPQFPHGAPPAEVELHYSRQVFLAWRKSPPLLVRPLRRIPDAQSIAASTAFLAGIAALLWHARTTISPPALNPRTGDAFS